jgi:hypothetical protein
MRRQTIEVIEVVGAEASVEAGAEALGGLGGVLGDVAGHLLGRQLPRLVVPLGDVVDVELLPPPGIPARLAVVQGWAGHGDGRDCLLEGVLEQVGAERRWWWGQAARATTVGGRVQAKDGVEVDRPAPLELGHLGIGDPDQLAQLSLLEADQPAEGTLQGEGGPSPQLRRQRVPEHLRPDVVAGRAEGFPQPRVVLVMTVPAASLYPVRAASGLPVGVAGQHQPALRLARVDPAEAGRGEGHEQPRMLADRLGDALAALEPGGQELVGISPVRWPHTTGSAPPGGCRRP